MSVESNSHHHHQEIRQINELIKLFGSYTIGLIKKLRKYGVSFFHFQKD